MRTLHVGPPGGGSGAVARVYTGLGYEVLGKVPETEFGSLTMLKLPGDTFVSIELVHDPIGGTVHPGGLNHLVIQVESMHDTIARLADEGVHVEPPQPPDGSDDSWTAWVVDPDGNRIELVQWPAGHPDGLTEADMSGQVGRDRASSP